MPISFSIELEIHALAESRLPISSVSFFFVSGESHRCEQGKHGNDSSCFFYRPECLDGPEEKIHSEGVSAVSSFYKLPCGTTLLNSVRERGRTKVAVSCAIKRQ